MRLRHLVHALQLFQPRLRLARFGGLGAETADKVLNVSDAPLLLLVLRLLLGHLLSALALIVRVAAPVGCERLPGDLQRALAGRIDKVAVVGDHQ